MNWNLSLGVFAINQPNHYPTNALAFRIDYKLFRKDIALGKAVLLIFVDFKFFRGWASASKYYLAFDRSPSLCK